MKFRLFITVIFISLTIKTGAMAETAVTFCRPNNMVSALAYIADIKGYFKEQGLNVKFREATNAKICIDELNAGKADVITGGEGPYTYTGFTKHSLKLVAQTGIIPETALFIRNDRSIITAKDLKGKRIAYLPGTVSYLYLARLLEKNKLTLKDVKLVALQPPAMPQALVGGIVDGFVMWEPWGDNALKQLGKNGKRLHDSALYNYRSNVIITSEFAKNKNTVESLLKALIKAESFMKDSPKEATAILSKEIKLDIGFLQTYLSQYQYNVVLDESLVALMKESARYIVRDDPNFKGKKIPDYKSMIDPSFLKTIDPTRVGAGF